MARSKKNKGQKAGLKVSEFMENKIETKVADTAKMKVNEKVQAINLTPWGGEHSYNLKVVKDKYGSALNDHNNDGKSNFKEALEGLKSEFPNLKKVSLVVGWYADVDKVPGAVNKEYVDAGKVTIKPKFSNFAAGSSTPWKVGNYTEKTAGAMLKPNGWSGTPTDDSLIEACKYLKSQGYDVKIYPMLFVDEKDQPWRGYVTPKNDADVKHFFNEYNKFIEHYATVKSSAGEKLIDYIDSLVVGTEMLEMTKYANSKGEHTGVIGFRDLAKKVHELAKAQGHDVKVTYSANWDEYQEEYMDILWNDKDIDMIAIDAYTPLGKKGTAVTDENVLKGWGKQTDLLEWMEAHKGKAIEFGEFGAASTSENMSAPYEWDNFAAKQGNEYMKTFVGSTIDFWNAEHAKAGHEYMPDASSMYLWDYDTRGGTGLANVLVGDDQKSYLYGLEVNGKLI